MITGHFKCLQCTREWLASWNPGQSGSQQECMFCEHKYVKWLNYEELFG